MARYWLMKSEPNDYSIQDLKLDGICSWEGVRNYQARNFMRDEMKVGDKVLFYHSNAKPSGVAGIAEICREAHPDMSAFDPNSKYFFPKSSIESPVWFLVDVKFVKEFSCTLSLDSIKKVPECQDMLLLKKGQRLSIMPIDKKHFDAIVSHS